MKIRTFFTVYTFALAGMLFSGIASIGAHHPLLTAIFFTGFGFSLHSVMNAVIFLRSRNWLSRP